MIVSRLPPETEYPYTSLRTGRVPTLYTTFVILPPLQV